MQELYVHRNALEKHLCLTELCTRPSLEPEAGAPRQSGRGINYKSSTGTKGILKNEFRPKRIETV